MKKIFNTAAKGLAAKFLAGTIIGLCFSCNHGRPCFNLKLTYDLLTLNLIGEPYGATDINAVSGNQGLSVAFNSEGTITVFKWPNPSFYDQVQYMTTERDSKRLGALANEGVFAGIYFEADSGSGFFWLRDLEHDQSYLGPRSVAVRTGFVNRDLGLEIIQTDFVAPGADVLWRHYQIQKLPGSKVRLARLLAFSNFAPKVSKWSRLPLSDWCLDSLGDSTLRWDGAKELFIQFREGQDFSTKKPSSVALAFGFDRKSYGHQAGYDHFCALKSPARDPFRSASKGSLDNSDFAHGKINSGIFTELEFRSQGQAEASFLVAAAKNKEQAMNLIEAERQKGFARALAEEEEHWRGLLAKVPLPATANQRIREVALRSVISLLLNYCPETSALVDSIATQPPYGEDWPRDGSYLNEALMAAGFGDLVKRHNLFYGRMQSRPGHRLPFVPVGNWASNYFADGVPGFPLVWWELDETGFALWSLYRYYDHTRDRAYLEQVYPAIKRAGDFLVRFRDPLTGLPKRAYETDELTKFKSFRGALSVYMGLKFAAEAANVLDDESSKTKWQKRQQELEKLMMTKYYDPACRRLVRFEKNRGDCSRPGAGWEHAQVLWPAGLLEFSDPRAEEFAAQSYQEIEPSFTGQRQSGLYEPYALLSLAKVWKNDPAKMAGIKNALLWEAEVPTTNTGLFGEIWIKRGEKVAPGQAQPQLWHHALFYLAAIEAFGKEDQISK